MELNEEMFEEILEKSSSNYLSYREDTGRLEMQILSKIEVVQPGEVGLDGNEWNPPVEDRDGNPLIQKFGPNKGEPVEPWPKVEVKVDVLSCEGDKAMSGEKIFRLGGINSGLTKNFIRSMKANEITQDDIVGTKWSVYGEKQQWWSYQIDYLGEGDVKDTSSNKPIKKEDKKDSKIDSKIIDALKVKKDTTSGEIPKTDILAVLSFATQKKTSEIEDMWQDLINAKLIKDNNGKVTIP